MFLVPVCPIVEGGVLHITSTLHSFMHRRINLKVVRGPFLERQNLLKSNGNCSTENDGQHDFVRVKQMAVQKEALGLVWL